MNLYELYQIKQIFDSRDIYCFHTSCEIKTYYNNILYNVIGLYGIGGFVILSDDNGSYITPVEGEFLKFYKTKNDMRKENIIKLLNGEFA